MKKENQFGIGVDIEDIRRFGKLRRAKDKLFLQKIFTTRELDYCFSKNNPAPHLAARFCAKEAVVKALFSLGKSDISYVDIEILKRSRGEPYVRFGKPQKIHVAISISHTKEMALASAFVVQV